MVNRSRWMGWIAGLLLLLLLAMVALRWQGWPAVPAGTTSSPVALPLSGATASVPPTSPVEQGGGRSARNAPPVGQRVPEEEKLLAQLERTLLPARDLFEIAVRFGRIPPDTPRVVSQEEPGYRVGDRLTFIVSNINTSEYNEVEATLRMQTAHASWWVANNVTVNEEALKASALVFEEKTYPNNRRMFGSEWSPGIDGDLRVHIFLGEVPGVGGYFSSADAFSRQINPLSNEKEIFYINLNNARPGNDYFDGILAHEFQHMIHWHVDRNEELWVNEGLSELAALINGFHVGDPVDAFLRQPDLPLTQWQDQSYPFYGSAFLFHHYFYERYGERAVMELVQEEANGTRGFDAVLEARGSNFDELFAEWSVATLLDEPMLGDGRYSYRRSFGGRPSPGQIVHRYPATGRDEVHQYGIDYIRFESDEGSGPLHLEVSGELLVRPLPTDARGGEWAFWSNRGDDSNSSLTRAFDLTGLQRATLRFWSWYDIEADYDYAYVAASIDGGKKWQILPTTGSVESNPHGNSFGPAFTGKSGGGERAIWQEQVVDLSPLAGQPILLRFEMITDDALNYNGLVIDDLSIPELGYQEGFEEGSGGWETEGFVRINSELPQRYIVQVVAEGQDGPQLFQLRLDEKNQGSLTIEEFGETIDHVTLIISGATPYTSEKATYRYSASRGPGERSETE